MYALKTLSCNAKNTDRHVDGGWDRAGHGRAGCAVACSKFNEVWNARLLLSSNPHPQYGHNLRQAGLKCATNKCAQGGSREGYGDAT